MSSVPSSRLAEVQAAFLQWRQTRPTPRIPLALRQQAVALLAEYRISEVMAALRVDHRALTRWRREVAAGTGEALAEAFVELPLTPAPVPAPALTPAPAPPQVPLEVALTLTYQRADGQTLSLSGPLSEAHWRWAVGLLREGGA